jgi:heme exporter protein C
MELQIESAVFTAILIGCAGYAALFIAPDESTMHAIQRIFYFHAPVAWAGVDAFAVTFIANIAYLATKRPKWDWIGVASAEVGLVFTTTVLITGPIWAHPVWGIWWTWEARLTSTLLLWLLYVAYVMLRKMVDTPERAASYAAIFGIFAYLDVPLVYLSIRFWRTQHPAPVVFGGAGSGLDPEMSKVFFFCVLVMHCLMVILVRQRYQLERLRYEIHEARLAAEDYAARAESFPAVPKEIV